VGKELMSLPNFEVISCPFYISNTVSMLIDMEGFSKERFC
jgi:hypothetical protein